MSGPHGGAETLPHQIEARIGVRQEEPPSAQPVPVGLRPREVARRNLARGTEMKALYGLDIDLEHAHAAPRVRIGCGLRREEQVPLAADGELGDRGIAHERALNVPKGRRGATEVELNVRDHARNADCGGLIDGGLCVAGLTTIAKMISNDSEISCDQNLA